MTTFWCPSDILITSWLFTARWSTWPGIHLVPCVAELVGFCILIYAYRCLPDPKCLFCPPGLSLCLSVDHFCIVPVDDMIIFHGLVCDGWLVSYTALPCPGGSGLCTSCERVHFFLVLLDPQTKLPVTDQMDKEALCIRKTPICMNRDAGSYQLSHTWDQMISRSRAPSGCKQSTRHDKDVGRTSKRH